MRGKIATVLPIYLAVAGCLQLASYAVRLRGGNLEDLLFYFDPRIGIFFLSEEWHTSIPIFIEWLSAVVLIALAFSIKRRRRARWYVAVETILSLPSLCFFVVVWTANMSPAHGFSRSELFYPLIVFLFFTVVPLSMAVLMRKETSVAAAAHTS